MNTYTELRHALIEALMNRADFWAEHGWVEESEIEDAIDDLIEEIGAWEKEHGVLKGISNPELFEDA